MRLIRSLFLLPALGGAFAAVDDAFSKVPAKDIITRDVCIIGGGSTGTYSAIQLRDRGKSVVVLEKKGRMGGHTETYRDPVTGKTVDIGVVVWHDLDIVKNYFKRLNVSISKADFGGGGGQIFVDFRTGKQLVNFTQPNPSNALKAYGDQLAKYPDIETGFNLPNPIPSDLLLPFGKFVQKYNLTDGLPFIFTFAQGLGDLLAQPTLYVFKNFGTDILKDIKTGFLTTTHKDNSELYEHATVELGADVLLNSTILAVDRSRKDFTRILVKTPSGVKVIHAKKILLTAPPKLDNLRPFDLDSTERHLFGQFRNSFYYTAVIRNSGIPDNLTITNVGSNTPFNLASLPGIYSIGSTGIPNLLNVKYGSAVELSSAYVQQDIIKRVKLLKTAGTLNVTNPEIAVFSAHVPFELTVPVEAIKKGFYRQLYGLQGHRNTFYTGAAFHTHDSSLLWQFTETVLPGLIQSL